MVEQHTLTSITQNIFNFASQSSSNLPNSQSRISRDIQGSVPQE